MIVLAQQNPCDSAPFNKSCLDKADTLALTPGGKKSDLIIQLMKPLKYTLSIGNLVHVRK